MAGQTRGSMLLRLYILNVLKATRIVSLSRSCLASAPVRVTVFLLPDHVPDKQVVHGSGRAGALSAVFRALSPPSHGPQPLAPSSHCTMNVFIQDSFEQQRVAKAKHARSRRRMKTLFKKAFELSSEDDTEVYLVTFRRGRFHEFNSMLDGTNQVLFPPAPSVVVRT